MAWTVLVNNVPVKTYPFKAQAFTYCLMNGYVYSGFDDWEFGGSIGSICVLDERVKIVRSEDE